MKRFFVWVNAVSCLAQLLGIIPSTILLVNLVGEHGTCSPSYFTTYSNATGCGLTAIGKGILGVHYAFDIIFAFILLLVYVLFLDWLSILSIPVRTLKGLVKDEGILAFMIGCSPVLIPVACAIAIIITSIAYIMAIMYMVLSVVWPVLFLSGRYGVMEFHSAWMHAKFIDIDMDEGWATRCRIIQGFNAFENVLEIVITLTLFIVGYTNVISILFSVPTFINIIVRLFYIIVEAPVALCEDV
jgi:hypothetical protein